MSFMKWLFAAPVLIVTGFVLDGTAQAKPIRTVLDGVYTESQASRGQQAYAMNCARCHGSDLESFSGPPLKGNLFMDRWREFNLNVLFDLIKDTMPRDMPGSLQDKDYLDILSQILRENGIPAGATELTSSAVNATLLVGKDGPKPLPNSAPVR